MRTTLRAILWISAAALAARAQNNELGLMLGPSLFRSQIPPAGTLNYVTFSGQADYAVQLHERGSGRLYLEFPVVIAGAVVQIPFGSLVETRIGGRLFVTPGIRWKWMPASRWSLYTAAGGGVRFSALAKPTFDVAMGGDFRLTRLFSLRMEARAYITPATPANVGLFHSIFLFGGVVHF